MRVKDLLKYNGLLYVMDTETTGFTADTADVIEISAIKVRCENGRLTVLDTIDEYVNPGYPLPPQIVEFNEKNGTGICDRFLADKPCADRAAGKVLEFMGLMERSLFGQTVISDNEPVIIVGHNIDKFDMPFIRKFFEAEDTFHASQFNADTVDTLIYSKENYAGKHNLGTMWEYTDKAYCKSHLPLDKDGNPVFHTSIADCFATLDVLDTFIKRESVTAQRVQRVSPTASYPQGVRKEYRYSYRGR